MKQGNTIAANVEGLSYNINAVAEVLKVSYDGRLIVRINNGLKDNSPKDQIVTASNWRVIPN